MTGRNWPQELGAHLAQNAAAWEEILGDGSASALTVFGRLEGVARGWAALHRDVLTPFGLNYAELTTIGMLRTSPPDFRRSPSELRGLVGQSSAGMTRILDKLEAENLVWRDSHAEDGRRVDVVLSSRGAALAEESFRALLAAETELLAAFGKRRREEVVGMLDGLLAAFEARER